jgi:hypothetical protein
MTATTAGATSMAIVLAGVGAGAGEEPTRVLDKRARSSFILKATGGSFSTTGFAGAGDI